MCDHTYLLIIARRRSRVPVIDCVSRADEEAFVNRYILHLHTAARGTEVRR